MNATENTMIRDTDSALMGAITARRDREAFTQLFERHQHAAYNLARHITCSADAAEEAVQEAMLQVWLSAASFEARGSVRGWILQIVARQSLKTIRGKQRERNHIQQATKARQNAAAPLPSEGLEREEVAAALRRVFDGLPTLDRQIVALHFGGGLTQEEIGEALSTPQRTVSHRMSKVLEQIRSNLVGAGFAAAVPVLLADHLNAALCCGETIPPELSRQILKHIFRVRLPSPSKLARTNIAAKGGGWVIAGSVSAIAAAGAAVVWWLLQGGGSAPGKLSTPGSQVSAGPAAQVVAQNTADPGASDLAALRVANAGAPAATAPSVTAPAAPANGAADEKRLHVRWSFEKGPPADSDGLEILGNWRWQNGSAGRIPGIEPRDTRAVVVKFPQKIPSGPVLITVKSMLVRDAQHAGVARWLKDAISPTYREWGVSRQFDDARITTQLYVIGRYVVDCLDGGDNIMNISKYETEHPAPQLCLVVKNEIIQEIELQSIREDDIPVRLRDIEKLIREWPSEGVDREAFDTWEMFNTGK